MTKDLWEKPMSKQIDKNEKKEKPKKSKVKFWKKGWWRSPKVIRAAVIVILAIIFFFVSFFWVPGDIYYRVKETFTFTAQEAASVNLTVLLPSSGPNQVVFDPQVEWPGTWQISEEGRLRVLSLEASIPAGETVKAVIVYRANLSQGAAQWLDEPVTAADADASDEVQSGAPEIIAQAELLQVAGDEAQTLRRLFAFTRDYLNTPQNPAEIDDESALTVFRTGVGGELGRANLLAALSRANGLPARVISGQRLPITVPLIPVTTLGAFPGSNGRWNEVFSNDVWALVDPNGSNGLFRPAAVGWSDGRYLFFGGTDQEAGVLQSRLEKAGGEGQWRASSAESLRYVAWADVDQAQLDLTPKVSVMTTWDARWVMLVSLVLIALMIVWLMEEKRPRKNLSAKEK
jgi:hypothetical protein